MEALELAVQVIIVLLIIIPVAYIAVRVVLRAYYVSRAEFEAGKSKGR